MALLQIEDPTAAPPAIGIDLGTTHSLVARVASTGVPVVLLDCDNEALVPSVVHYGAGGRIVVGRDAAALATQHPHDTIVSVKRFMGRGADDPETRRLGPYRFATDEGPVVKFAVNGERVVTPVEVSAEILRHLLENAEDELGQVGGAVITVPAYFDDAQRQATKDAAKLAGMDVLRLLNEPTAAALAYGLDSKQNGLFAVYDLGGGTFDITILSLDDGVFQVRSTGGDSQLGGDDMDRALAHVLLERMGVSEQDASASLKRQVLTTARSIKHALTDAETVTAEVELEDGKRFEATVTRAEFDALVEPLAQRAALAVRRALRDAEVSAEDIDGVILVGGSTRVPFIRSHVQKLFGKQPLGSIDPDQVVALGAAVQADLLAGGQEREGEVLLLDVLPLSLGIETMGGVVEKILPRNTPIPAGAGQEFTTYADNQTGFELHVLQGERELADDCRSLARFTLRGIPPMPAGMARLAVSFRVDADGLLSVEAQEQSTGIKQEVEVKPSYGLTDEEVEQMLIDAYEHGEQDVKLRSLREQQVEGKRILAALTQAMDADRALLNDAEETAAIEGAIQQLREALDGDDHGRIRTRIEELDQISKGFAGRRMDRSIQAALSGRRVGGLESETKDARGIEPHLGGAQKDE